MEEALTKISLSEQVKNLLKEKISNGSLKPGQRIEPVRSLLKKYKVSHNTAAAALKELQQEGWITSKVGRGSFVSNTPPLINKTGATPKNTANVIYFIISNSNEHSLNSSYAQILNYLQKSVAKHDLLLKIVSGGNSESLAEIAASPEKLGIIYSTDNFPLSVNVPVVSYGMSYYSTGRCFVQPDNFQGGKLSGEILLKYGHRNICYVTVNTNGPDREIHFKQRYNGLCMTFENAGFPYPESISWHSRAPESRREVTELLKRIKAKAPNAPTALVIGNMNMASEIYMIAIGMGIHIPEDLSIISFIKREESSDDHISFIDFSHKDMAQQMISLILCSRNLGIQLQEVRHLLPMFLCNDDSIKKLN